MNHIPTDTIIIDQLTLEMSVGIYEQEKQNRQRVLISITLSVESPPQKINLQIEDVVSYETIIREVTDLSKAHHYDLLEEFAEDIAHICLINPKTKSAKIKVLKPDIFPHINAVGVEIFRENMPHS